MSRWRVILITVLLLLPIVIWIGAGLYALWERGGPTWLLWIFPPCWLLAWALLRFRPRSPRRKRRPRPLPVHWTPRDQAAFEIVRQAKESASEVPVSELSNPHFYLQSALDLSLKIAQHYHPKSSDPISSLTVLEVLAAAQLAIEDTAEWLHRNVPGSHLLTIRHWRALSRAPQWMQTASDVSWLLAMLWNPLTLPRWLATRFASTSATQEIEASLLAAIYREFLHNVGLYCIEMNSGRLRGGVARNRAAMERLRHHAPRAERPPSPARGRLAVAEGPTAGDGQRPAAVEATAPTSTERQAVRIAVMGQVNAGKSSLINSLLGENRARCDVIATTSAIERFRYSLPRSGEQFELTDTPGFGSSELTPIQRNAIREAWSEADLVLLVMDVTSPARAADWRAFEEVNSWFLSQPHLKPPRVFGVLTHIDNLPPVLEWEPPYDWKQPVRTKEKNIRAAVEYTEQIFADSLDAVIPVCTDARHGRIYGVQEWLVPALVASLPEAKASLVVRMLHQEADAERLALLVRQLRSAGMQVLRSLLRRAEQKS